MISVSSRAWPAASRARGSGQRPSTARSVLVSSPVSGVAGVSCRTRSLIRRWCSAACWVSRSRARTRPWWAARAGAGWRASSGSRARVSASMPLDLACRDRNVRRSAALRARHPEHPMPAGGEEHRDRRPRRPGRLDHHLQPDPGRSTGQCRGLDRGQALHRRAGAGGDRPRFRRRRAPARCGRWRCPDRSRSGACRRSLCALLAADFDRCPPVGRDGLRRAASGHGPTRRGRRPVAPGDGSHSCAASGPDLAQAPTHFPHPGHP